MTRHQAAIILKAKESVRAARLLADEEIYDFAVSRAYYTMFYVAEALLLGEGVKFSKHSAVISAFGKLFARTKRVPQEFHTYLIEGQNKRLIGDYDASISMSQDDARTHVARAEQFLELAEQMLGPLPSEVAKHG